MTFSKRRLPHLFEIGRPVFITWRLHDSLPTNREFPKKALTSSEAFAAMDRLLEETRSGTFYLRQPAIAEMIVEAIQHNASVLNHYELHAYVVMPNHVHLLITPAISLSNLMRSLKGITAKRGNEMLGLVGQPFWQEESYDHLVRNRSEFEKIQTYIESNPVRASLVSEPHKYRRSTAHSATGGSPADPGVRPTALH
jgi:REP element-mobilizing transposase RayT